MSEELKPCPFCGSPATYTDGEDAAQNEIFVIGCKQKGCVAYMRDIGNYFYTLENAIHAWNRRAGQWK